MKRDFLDYIPEKWDIVWLNFNPQSWKEQAWFRPALVISPRSYNEKVWLAVFCPITSNKKSYPFEVELWKNLETKWVIISDHLKNLDWKVKQASFIEKIWEKELNEVLEKIEVLIF